MKDATEERVAYYVTRRITPLSPGHEILPGTYPRFNEALIAVAHDIERISPRYTTEIIVAPRKLR
jgi:hypothetical protein